MSPHPSKRPDGPRNCICFATTRLFETVVGRKFACGVSSSTREGYIGARMTWRRSRANGIWEMSGDGTLDAILNQLRATAADAGEIDDELWCVEGTIVRAAGGGEKGIRRNRKTTHLAAVAAD